MTPDAYLSAVESLVGAPLSSGDAEWMFNARIGGTPPEQFAYWITLTASPSVVPRPLDDGWSENPRQIHESLPGEEFRKERA